MTVRIPPRSCRFLSLRYTLVFSFARMHGEGSVANGDGERFENAEKYDAYLATFEGRLRLDLAFANLQDFLPKAGRPLHALDFGCGTGAIAVHLARLGFHVTAVDSSVPMLNRVKRAAEEAALESIAVEHGDVSQVAGRFEAGAFDVIVCHNLLEYVADPLAVLRDAFRVLREQSGVISVMVRNQAGDVLKSAIQSGDLLAADNSLGAEWGRESLYGGEVRLFTPEGLRAMLRAASLAVVAERGVRVVSDYLPSRVSRDNDYQRIFELEQKLGRRPDFAAVARYIQFVAHRESID